MKILQLKMFKIIHSRENLISYCLVISKMLILLQEVLLKQAIKLLLTLEASQLILTITTNQ
ncbi:MAG: hypothetical protein COA94_07715 [Rickettsiales bacterium]|nr:MAG: hypothetical protein COA94_07715 [Rickettsiales bacterium]